MAITGRANQYRGVNAHLHSHLQNTAGAWEEFHTAHLVDLARAIESQRPQRPKRGLSVQHRHYRPTPLIIGGSGIGVWLSCR